MINFRQSGNSFTIQKLAESNQPRIDPASIYIASMDLVLLIGGQDYSDDDDDFHFLNTVSAHHIGEDRWRMLPQTLNYGR